jgi:hypothetical protein
MIVRERKTKEEINRKYENEEVSEEVEDNKIIS